MVSYPFFVSSETNAVSCFHNELLNCTLAIIIQSSVNSCKPFPTASYVLALFPPFLMSPVTYLALFSVITSAESCFSISCLISFHGFTFPVPYVIILGKKWYKWYKLAEDVPCKFEFHVWEYCICYFFVGFEVLIAVVMKNSVVWDIM
jgi:hypothetical protein